MASQPLPEPSLDFGGRGPWPVCVDGYERTDNWLVARSHEHRYIYLDEERKLLEAARKLANRPEWGPWSSYLEFSQHYGLPVMPRRHLRSGRWGVQVTALEQAVKTFAELDTFWIKGKDRNKLALTASTFLHEQQAGQVMYEISRTGQLLPRLRLGPPLAAAVLRLGGEVPTNEILRSCACGCGTFLANRANQMYRSSACRQRAARRRKTYGEPPAPESGVPRWGGR